MNKILTLLTAVAFLGFISLGVINLTKTDNKLKLKDIQLKDTSAELKLNELKYNQLNTQLDKAVQDKSSSQQQIQELQKQKQDLENQKQDLEKQVQAKLDAQKAAQEQLAQAASISRSVYAQSFPTACNDAKSCIYFHESGNSPCKIYGGAVDCNYKGDSACGLGQALPCSKLRNVCALSDYACEDSWFTNYALQRYGSWSAAWSYWQAHSNW